LVYINYNVNLKKKFQNIPFKIFLEIMSKVKIKNLDFKLKLKKIWVIS